MTQTNTHKSWWNYNTVFPITIVILIIYFDILNHYWFLKLLRGYVIKVWLFPVALFSFFLFKKFMQQNFSFPSKNISKLIIILLIYVVMGCCAIFIHENLWNKGKYFLLMFGPVMLFFSIIYGLRDNDNIIRVLKLLFLQGLIFSLYVFYLFSFVGVDMWRFKVIERRFMFSDTKGIMADPYKYNVFAKHVDSFAGDKRGVIIRRSIPGVDEPRFGGMLTPMVFIGLYFALNSKRYLRIFYYTSALFLLYTVMTTLARSSIVGLLVGTVLFFVYFFVYWRKKITTFILGFITIVLILVIVLYTEGVMDRMIQLISSTPILGQTEFATNLTVKRDIYVREDGHIQSYIEGIKVLAEAPLFGALGVGVQNFTDMFTDYRWAVPHNRYMYILNTTGFLTLLPYVGFIIVLIVNTRKAFLSRLGTLGLTNNVGLILYPSIVALAIKLNNEGMETYYYWIFFGLAVAWIRNLAYEEKNENTAN